MAVYSLLFGHAEWPDEPVSERAPLDALADREPTARLTVRVPRALERRLEASADLAGLSREAFVERALSRSVDPRVEAWT